MPEIEVNEPYFNRLMSQDFENTGAFERRDWIEYPNGMIIAREAGLKYYPSGLLTTLNDYIFPEVFYDRNEFEERTRP